MLKVRDVVVENQQPRSIELQPFVFLFIRFIWIRTSRSSIRPLKRVTRGLLLKALASIKMMLRMSTLSGTNAGTSSSSNELI